MSTHLLSLRSPVVASLVSASVFACTLVPMVTTTSLGLELASVAAVAGVLGVLSTVVLTVAAGAVVVSGTLTLFLTCLLVVVLARCRLMVVLVLVL